MNQQLDQARTPSQFLGDLDKENWTLCRSVDVHQDDISVIILTGARGIISTSTGLPVLLQLLGRRFDDEKVLAILDYTSKEIGLPFDQFP